MPSTRLRLARLTWTALAALLVAAGSYLVLQGNVFRSPALDPRWQVSGGDPGRGKLQILGHGCGACHVIPGIRSATGRVGPQLRDIRRQMYIAGLLPNTPENLVQWIHQPQRISPGNAMPDLPLTESQARDIAAYLYAM
jgi:cytochrome c